MIQTGAGAGLFPCRLPVLPLSLHGRSAGSEAIPEPVKQLPVMGGRPLNRVQSLAKIAEIKAKFGLKGASV